MAARTAVEAAACGVLVTFGGAVLGIGLYFYAGMWNAVMLWALAAPLGIAAAQFLVVLHGIRSE